MKIFVAVGLLCLVGLSVSYPAQPNERNQRRRNQVSAPQPFRSRQSERISDLPDYQPSRPKKISQYQPLGPQAFTAQERYANPAPQQQKRKAPVQQLKPATENVRDYEAAPSNAYGGGGYEAGSYDEGHLKFEQGVQNHANSYNSDQGVKDGRVQFAIAGQQGPNSYRFGYDTGKGADRVFRIEEKDAAGVIHGRYGFYDPSGIFRIVNYSAHPEHGFKSDSNIGPH